MIDQAELARRCARPDATLPDFVHARGRHLSGNGHAGEEAAVYILDRKLQELQIGRAHVCTPVTNAHIVCRLLLEKKIPAQTHTHNTTRHLEPIYKCIT